MNANKYNKERKRSFFEVSPRRDYKMLPRFWFDGWVVIITDQLQMLLVFVVAEKLSGLIVTSLLIFL